MLPLQRPPSSLRSYWTVWTSLLKHTHIDTFKDCDVTNSSCQEQENAKQTYQCFWSHWPDRLSLSLTESWVTSSVGSSLRQNRQQTSECFGSITSMIFLEELAAVQRVAFGLTENMLEMICWTVLFLVPGTRSTKKQLSAHPPSDVKTERRCSAFRPTSAHFVIIQLSLTRGQDASSLQYGFCFICYRPLN